MSPRICSLLMIWSGAVALFGLVLVGGGFAPTAAATRTLLTIMGGGTALEMTAPLRFAVGLMGAVTLGWGLSLLAIASVSHRLDPAVARTLWHRIAIGFGIWYVVDCIISIATGFALNALSNTLILAAFLAILWSDKGALRRPVPAG